MPTTRSVFRLNNTNAVIIQKYARRYLIMKRIDNYDFDRLISSFNAYKNRAKVVDETNKNNKGKRLRHDNFYSDVSENIAKFALHKFIKVWVSWNTKVGDLCMFGHKIEVKGFISNGPCSFGPRETWDKIIFVDARDFRNNHVKVYLFHLSDSHEEWNNIRMNRTRNTRMLTQRRQGIRPRIIFDDLLPQIDPNKIRILFDGDINDLNE